MAREAPGYQGRGPPRRVVPPQDRTPAGCCAGFSKILYTEELTVVLNDTIAKLGSFEFCEFENAGGVPAESRRRSKMCALARARARRARYDRSGRSGGPRSIQCASSPQASPNTSAPGRAAGGPRRGP